MTVNFEVKGMLARLLATEDIVVEHRKVETACFNVQTRVLTLPIWDKATDNIYSMLVAHEVGHARETPTEDWMSTHKIPMQFVNVVEDARIEKLMKRRYNGLAKTFYSGYKELHEQDFFQLKNEDLSKFNLADRVNLFFKIGNFISLKFSEKEQEIVDLITDAETFSDVLYAAEVLHKYCKDDLKDVGSLGFSDLLDMEGMQVTISSGNFMYDKDSDDQDSGEPGMGSVSDSQPIQPSESQDSAIQNDNSPNGGKKASNDVESSSGGKESEEKEPEIRTMSILEDKLRELSNMMSDETIYLEIPSVNLETIIGKNSEVHQELDTSFQRQLESADRNIFKTSDSQYKKFKASAQKEVNYLVKEFECKKAADSYSRASVSRTGVLDCSRLHSYKYTEDLFKKVTTLAEGKNHGLVFVLDWSGSMSGVMLDTIKQLYNLIWFCKKVSLPFEVYAFTNEWSRVNYDPVTNTHTYRPPHYHKREGLLCVDDGFTMMNILTSKVSSSMLEKQLLNIWRIAYCFADSYRCPYSYPSRFSLSGTPLNESLISLFEIIPKFQKDNNLQKVQCIVLTDGEAGGIGYHTERTQYDGSTRLTIVYSTPNDNCFIRDRKIGTTYKLDLSSGSYTAYTNTILKNLRDRFQSTNFIGIRVLESRDAYRFISLYYGYQDKEYDKIQNDWKKLKSFSIHKSGYHSYFGISANSLSQDTSFEVSENASKTQIKSAFVNSLKTKKTNKKILSEFITLIV